MTKPGVGAVVTVTFNGSPYTGEVVRETPKRALVRFTTGSGRTRENWFSFNPGPGYAAASYFVPGTAVGSARVKG